jgi:predicted ABC-type transport system involved in lysophospholipase L1 biosynthesis ATPase subunit
VLLSLEGVTKAFPRGELRLRVLDDAWLTVDAGEVVSVVALRGAGKSTLLRLAAGLERPDGGRVLFAGQDLATLSDRRLSRLLREDVGLAGRSGPGMRLRMIDYVELPLLLGGGLLGAGRRHRATMRAQAHDALERVGLGERLGHRWESLSDWDRALAEIAQAIVTRPRLLIMDDVTDGLSLREIERIAAILRELARETGLGVLIGLSTDDAALGARRVHLLSRGRLQTVSDLGPVGNVVRPPDHLWGRSSQRAARDA